MTNEDNTQALLRANWDQVNWDKGQGLLPAIIQDERTAQVLMLGYMNQAALNKTLEEGCVTFFSRSRQCLWTKGETSGHKLALVDIKLDCDQDTFLIKARRHGPVCHTGTRSCWGEEQSEGIGFLMELANVIGLRAQENKESSYTARLLNAGLPRIAQKVGEEGVELALAAVVEEDEALTGEAADLLYHLLVLLEKRQIPFESVIKELIKRHAP